MSEFLTVATQVAVLFALMGVGAAFRRLKLLDDAAIRGFVNVLLLVVTPSLIVTVFRRPFDAALLGCLGVAFVVALGVHLLAILVAKSCLRGGADGTRAVLRSGVVFSNAGFMGVPLQQAILGETGVFFGVVYVVVFNLIVWSWGLGVMRGTVGTGKWSAMSLVNPGTVGVALGIVVFVLPGDLPAVVASPVKFMADLNTPLAMLVIGYQLAGAKLGAVVRLGAAWGVTAIRLVVLPLVVLGALWFWRATLPRELIASSVIATACPVAAMVTMFATRYGRDVDVSVGLVSGTTLLSLVTLPPVITLTLKLI